MFCKECQNILTESPSILKGIKAVYKCENCGADYIYIVNSNIPEIMQNGLTRVYGRNSVNVKRRIQCK